MANTGIMEDSGEFRTNPSSGGNKPSGGGAFSNIGAMFADRAHERRKEQRHLNEAAMHLEGVKFKAASELLAQRERLAHEGQQAGAGRIFDATEATAKRTHQLNVMKLQHKQANQLIGSGKVTGKVNITQGDHSVQANIAKPTSPKKPVANGGMKPRADGSHLPSRQRERYRNASPTEKRAINQKYFYGANKANKGAAK